MTHELLQPDAGGTLLLLGNEAIVRGALEAGVNMVTCYPGTPSSEVPDTFYRMRGEGNYRLEYSVNEKVAFEVAAGAALAGAMALVTMKHVGVNVAADPLFTAAYTGLPGGLVLLSADDPGCHSSQNEQDNRHYARAAGMPCFEPASAQEAKDMARDALLLARELQQPVLLRTTTRLNHLRGSVRLGPLPGPAPRLPFESAPGRFVPVPAVARKRHLALEENLARARDKAETSPWNRTSGNGKAGIIASGIARAYLADALHEGGWHDTTSVLQLGLTWPLPTQRIAAFLRACDKVLIIEEGAPLLERDIRALAQELGIATPIIGKGATPDAPLNPYGEYTTAGVKAAVADFLGERLPATPDRDQIAALPGRPPNLCPGCSHRAVYYAVRKVYGDGAVYSSDIGCYTLGLLPPLRMADFLVCMGSSVSAGSGFAAMDDKPAVAFIGDSTFFHSGMTGLANAVFNRHNILLVVLDNGTTAMTGHQPNPGMVQEMLGATAAHLDIETIVRALGVPHIRKVKAYNLRAVTRALEDLKAESGVRVLIAEEPCVLYARRSLKKAAPQVAEVSRQGPEAEACLEELACPAFMRVPGAGKGDIAVDASLCSGCMVCLQIAPQSFRAVRRQAGGKA